MRARAKRLPGQPGTKALLKIYGDKLVCVRYRYDTLRRRRYKTAEIIVDEAPWQPPVPRPKADEIVHVYVAPFEANIIRQVKLTGGQWRPEYQLWALPYAQAVELDLLDRILEPRDPPH